MEILSYGNQIRCGIYELHSKFRTVANFISNDDFVFVVSEKVGAGPFNVVLHHSDIEPIRTLLVENDSISLNDKKYFLNDYSSYNPTLELSKLKIDRFNKNILLFEYALVEYSPPKSLTFLIDKSRRKEFKSAFEIEYVKRFENAISLFLSDEYLDSIRMIKGMGPGLTPSGDDFISGVLIALNLSSKINSIDYSEVIKQIYQTAKSENQFTNTFMKCAADGFLFEKFKELINSLFHSDENEIIEHTKSLFEVGVTSGADQAAGFLFGMKRF